MSGSVSRIFECPRCSAPISGEERPEKCPKCGFKFLKPDEALTQEFSWQKSPDIQFFELVQQDCDAFFDLPIPEIAKALGKPLPAEKEKELKDATVSNKMRKEFIQQIRGVERDVFMMKSHPDDIEGWVKSIHYLMTLAIPSGNRELISKLASWGEEIGKMSKVLSSYLNAGGKINEYHLTSKQKKLIEISKRIAELEEELNDERDKETTEENT